MVVVVLAQSRYGLGCQRFWGLRGLVLAFALATGVAPEDTTEPLNPDLRGLQQP